jgi:ABC-type amino acid transport system permease subunit
MVGLYAFTLTHTTLIQTRCWLQQMVRNIYYQLLVSTILNFLVLLILHNTHEFKWICIKILF